VTIFVVWRLQALKKPTGQQKATMIVQISIRAVMIFRCDWTNLKRSLRNSLFNSQPIVQVVTLRALSCPRIGALIE
jgi:hypothetical protein